ncbi:toll/interleukin-1 receptor domain-containing protein [Candidatus Villigracilis affinis]|uniref:toll/interleukin-1 receptor domain-containing protein n=1 Tax=Candidatus Villigracilis affinis TaxID=3140682 RepID=UPI001DE5F16E|nr:toll/interleukin-1 receptor domain-containing protein [Anaerolineales bacterium]
MWSAHHWRFEICHVVQREGRCPAYPDHEEHAKMYGKDDVFISYSRKDSEVARTFKTVLEGTGLDVFLDVDDIRSGQLWEEELKRRIERAKIFQIFWSANYSQSENCKQEWEYALKQNKDEGYIRPVFWQKPLTPNPPEELNKFNFKYVELRYSPLCLRHLPKSGDLGRTCEFLRDECLFNLE